MHRCLKIPEIVSNVCHHLNPDNTCEGGDDDTAPKTKNCRSLAALARSCKQFQEPALNKLWSHQYSLVPLVLCLPTDAYRLVSTGPKKRPISIVSINRRLVSDDYTCIQFYARRIRLFATSGSFCRIGGKVYRLDGQVAAILLLCTPKHNHILPDLLDLTLHERAFVGSAVLPRILVGSRLRSVHIQAEQFQGSHSCDNIATVFSPYAANIESFVYEHSDIGSSNIRTKEMLLSLDQLYNGFRNLRRLKTRIVNVSNATIHHLSSLPGLQQLDISLDNLQLFQTNHPNQSDIIEFRELKDMFLTTSRLCFASSFLSWVGLENLQRLTIEWEKGDESHIQKLISALIINKRHLNSPLTSLTICWKKSKVASIEDVVQEEAVLVTTLEPLLSFQNISTLVITPCQPSFLDDAILLNMSGAWPNLQTLVLADKTCSTVDLPRVTLSGIVPLIKSCSNLIRLEIRLDANKVPTYAEFGPLPSDSPLEELHVFYSIIDDALSVATFLILSFPRLSKFSHSWGEISQGNGSHKWKDVEQRLKPLLESHKKMYG